MNQNCKEGKDGSFRKMEGKKKGRERTQKIRGRGGGRGQVPFSEDPRRSEESKQTEG